MKGSSHLAQCRGSEMVTKMTLVHARHIHCANFIPLRGCHSQQNEALTLLPEPCMGFFPGDPVSLLGIPTCFLWKISNLTAKTTRLTSAGRKRTDVAGLPPPPGAGGTQGHAHSTLPRTRAPSHCQEPTDERTWRPGLQHTSPKVSRSQEPGGALDGRRLRRRDN